MIEKKWFKCCSKTKEYLLDTLDSARNGLFEEKNDETSDLDEFFLPLLKTVIGEGAYADVQLDLLLGKLPQIHTNNEIVKIVKIRWAAVSLMHQGKTDECIKSLKTAYEASLASDNFPDWLANDILIDIRNQAGIWSVSNESGRDAQTRITASTTEIYFPLLDRFNSSLYSNLVANYEKSESTPPHTIELGSGHIREIVELAFNKFLVASYYGSITHMGLLNFVLKKLLFSVNLKYANSKYFRNYIKACVLGWEGKVDEDSLSNTFQERFSLTTREDAKILWESTNRIANPQVKLNAKLNILRYLGNFMDDKTFHPASDECMQLSVSEDALLFSSGYVEKFLKENAHRMDVNAVIDFVFKKLNGHINFICTIFLGSLINMDYSRANEETLATLKQLFSDKENHKSMPLSLFILMIVLRKSVDEKYHKELDEIVKKNHTDFYEHQYSYEIHMDEESEKKFILKELSIAKNENTTQGLDGSIRYGYQPLSTLRNILMLSKNKPCNNTLLEIVETVRDTLNHNAQPTETKILAAQLLLLLLQKYNGGIVATCATEFFEKRNHVDGRDGFFKSHTKTSLKLVLTLIGCLQDKICAREMMFALASINELKVSEQIEVAGIFYRFVSRLNKNSIDGNLLTLLFQFILSSTYSNSNVIRHYAIRTLTHLSNHVDNVADDIIYRFAEMFNYETVSNKSYLMDGAWKIDRDNSLTLEMFELASQNSNYHIRKLSRKVRSE